MPDYRVGVKMKAAEDKCEREHKMTLKAYLRDQINRGRQDIELGKEFGVDRHTITNWKRLLGITTVKRAHVRQ